MNGFDLIRQPTAATVIRSRCRFTCLDQPSFVERNAFLRQVHRDATDLEPVLESILESA